MKILLAMLSGFVLTLAIFGGGALTAVDLIAKEPPHAHPLDMETGALWTNKAVSVNTASHRLKRLPARPTPQQSDQKPQSVGATTTAAIAPTPEVPAVNVAHVEWCSRHYRSYDPGDNSYNAYSGIRRECVSPYSDNRPDNGASNIITASSKGVDLVSAVPADEVNPDGAVSDEHIWSCFDRYRSYRPEDNTYQPYGGGPRQQCE